MSELWIVLGVFVIGFVAGFLVAAYLYVYMAVVQLESDD